MLHVYKTSAMRVLVSEMGRYHPYSKSYEYEELRV